MKLSFGPAHVWLGSYVLMVIDLVSKLIQGLVRVAVRLSEGEFVVEEPGPLLLRDPVKRVARDLGHYWIPD